MQVFGQNGAVGLLDLMADLGAWKGGLNISQKKGELFFFFLMRTISLRGIVLLIDLHFRLLGLNDRSRCGANFASVEFETVFEGAGRAHPNNFWFLNNFNHLLLILD